MITSPRSNESMSDGMSRRGFLRVTAGVGAAVAGTAGAPLVWPVASARAAAGGAGFTGAVVGDSENLVAQLFTSLNEAQRAVIVKGYDDPLRLRVDANWRITKPIAEVLDADQQDLVKQVFTGLHSEEYAGKVLEQVNHDNVGHGGFSGCSIAIFGEPGGREKPFEFVFTGRHVTRRCDGNHTDGQAFAGPMFYGHAFESFNEKPTHPGNIYWYQAVRANELYQMLDGRQRQLALRDDPRAERSTKTVELRAAGEIPGLPWTELSADQKSHAMLILKDLLSPFRPADSAEALAVIEAGGLDKLRLSYFENMDLGDDGVWDVWELEGPQLVWHFRGSPHVHTWVRVRG